MKVRRNRYTIILPTDRSLQKEIDEYTSKDLSHEQINQKREEARRLLPIWIYGTKWEEMGHVLATEYGMGYHLKERGVSEGIAEAYTIKGLLLAVKKGLFPEEDVLLHLDILMKEWKSGMPGRYMSRYRAGLMYVLPNFDHRYHEKKRVPIDETINEINRRIDRALELYGKKWYQLKSKADKLEV